MVSNLVVEIAIYNFDLFHFALLYVANQGKRAKKSKLWKALLVCDRASKKHLTNPPAVLNLAEGRDRAK